MESRSFIYPVFLCDHAVLRGIETNRFCEGRRRRFNSFSSSLISISTATDACCQFSTFGPGRKWGQAGCSNLPRHNSIKALARIYNTTISGVSMSAGSLRLGSRARIVVNRQEEAKL